MVKSVADLPVMVMRTCLACDSEKVRAWGQKSDHDFYLCRTCGYIFTQAKADASSQLEDLYNHYYDDADFEPDPVIARSLNRSVRFGERFRSAGRWLDIGYGEGTLLKIAEANGWQ